MIRELPPGSRVVRLRYQLNWSQELTQTFWQGFFRGCCPHRREETLLLSSCLDEPAQPTPQKVWQTCRLQDTPSPSELFIPPKASCAFRVFWEISGRCQSWDDANQQWNKLMVITATEGQDLCSLPATPRQFLSLGLPVRVAGQSTVVVPTSSPQGGWESCLVAALYPSEGDRSAHWITESIPVGSRISVNETDLGPWAGRPDGLSSGLETLCLASLRHGGAWWGPQDGDGSRDGG